MQKCKQKLSERKKSPLVFDGGKKVREKLFTAHVHTHSQNGSEIYCSATIPSGEWGPRPTPALRWYSRRWRNKKPWKVLTLASSSALAVLLRRPFHEQPQVIVPRSRVSVSNGEKLKNPTYSLQFPFHSSPAPQRRARNSMEKLRVNKTTSHQRPSRARSSCRRLLPPPILPHLATLPILVVPTEWRQRKHFSSRPRLYQRDDDDGREYGSRKISNTLEKWEALLSSLLPFFTSHLGRIVEKKT